MTEYINVGAGVGGGFTNTNELRVMKYHEAINGPDGKKWKVKVKQNMEVWLKVVSLRKSSSANFLVL